MITINRRYYDEYFYDLACKLSELNTHKVIYDPLQTDWIDHVVEGAVVFTQDCYSYDNDQQRLTDADIDRIKALPEFYLASSVYNLQEDIDLPNVTHLHPGSDLLFQKQQYSTLLSAEAKSWQGEHWVTLGRVPRPHRLAVAEYLKKSGLSGTSIRVDKKSFPATANNNAMNFNIFLRDIYVNTAVEIVLETTFYNKGIFVTEKYLNSVYGYNFPILIANCGTVEYLQNQGFDLFTDIVDHSYDKIQDPAQRLQQAIDKNIHLLEDKDHAIEQWESCKDRFDKNLAYARKDFYTWSANKFMCSATNLA